MRKTEVLIAGRGGQGILLAGYVLGLALAKKRGYYVVNSESYSAETRGGDSRSELVVSSSPEEADLIRVRRADIAVFMYGEQMKRYSSRVKRDALVLLDSTFIKRPHVSTWRAILVPFTDIAGSRLGNFRVANMVMLGTLSQVTGLVDKNALVSAVREVVSPRWVKINIEAIELGASYAVRHVSQLRNAGDA